MQGNRDLISTGLLVLALTRAMRRSRAEVSSGGFARRKVLSKVRCGATPGLNRRMTRA
jgi:hypothetical protein